MSDEQTHKEVQQGVDLKLKRISSVSAFPPDTVSETYKSAHWRDYADGYKLPGWQALIAAGADATTPFIGFRSSIRYTPAFLQCVANHKATGWIFSETLEGCPFPVSDGSITAEGTVNAVSSASAENIAIAKLYSQILSLQSAVRSGEDFGELRQTLGMLRSPVQGLRTVFLRACKQFEKAAKRRRTRTEMLKVISDTYLEFQFGWNPLALEVGSVLAAWPTDRSTFRFYGLRAGGHDLVDGVLNTLTGDGAGVLMYDSTTQIRTETFCNFRGMYSFGPEGGIDPNSTGAKLGLLPGDFVSTFWNLMPYSFVADYFTNIGTIADSWSVVWSNVRWCCKSVSRQVTTTYGIQRVRLSDPANFDLIHIANDCGQCVIVSKKVERSRQSSVPVPTLQFRLPGLGSKPWTNMAALVASKAKFLRNAFIRYI
jgi:hypothetical protein